MEHSEGSERVADGLYFSAAYSQITLRGGYLVAECKCYS